MIYFFDTETTGLPTNYNDPTQPNMPSIVQYAGIMTMDDGRIVRTYSSIIKVSEKIPDSVSKIHGITNELSDKAGVGIGFVLEYHIKSIYKCSLLVGHNLSFDQLMIESEVFRHNKRVSIVESIDSIPKTPCFCTMKSSTNLVKIPNGLRGYKWPKLQEIHKFLFGCEFQGAHDALDDVRATVKCYFELKKRGI